MTFQNLKINFKKIKDKKSNLLILEKNCLPFKIKRIYSILSNSSKKSRGFHAHKLLDQLIFCLQGSCEILLDDGKKKKIFKLKNNGTGLKINKMIWHEIHNIKKNTILIILANEIYKENDYIRCYEKFKRLI